LLIKTYILRYSMKIPKEILADEDGCVIWHQR
jgi:hypothetical protein